MLNSFKYLIRVEIQHNRLKFARFLGKNSFRAECDLKHLIILKPNY